MSEVNQQPKPLKQQAPKIRFEGFSESWVNKVISEFIQLRSETDNQDKYSIDVELENLVSNKGILIGDLTVRTQTNSIFRKGDILFGRLRPYLNKWWLADQDGVKSGEIWALYPKDQFVNTFIYACVQDQKFLNFVNQTSGTKMPRANWSSVQKESLSISLDYKEQTQIGNFFQELDKLIELQTRAVESAETYKKAMLQKMFPQKGEKVPKVRFEGFSGDWETTYFSNIASVRRGLTYSPSDIVANGEGVRVLRSSNIDEDTLIVFNDDVFVREEAVKIDYIKINEILITSANGSSRLVGKHAIINQDLQKTVHGGFMLIVSTSQPEFINSWMNGVQYKNMLRLVQGGNGAIGNLSRSMLEECKITLPTLEEQTKIGNYFQELDRSIESEKQKLEQYQTMKRAMLQRMFV